MLPPRPQPPSGLTETRCLDGGTTHAPVSDGKIIWCTRCWLKILTVPEAEAALNPMHWEFGQATTEQKVAALEVAIGDLGNRAELAILQKYQTIIDDQEVDEQYRVMCRQKRDELQADRDRFHEALRSLPPKEPRRRRRR